MPYKEPKIEKVYFSIGEIAEMFNVNPSLLRYWEKEFDILKPKKNRKGTRQYSRRDIEQIKLIYHLVKERGMTLEGARRRIKDNREDVDQTHEVVTKLKSIRKLLTDMHDQL